MTTIRLPDLVSRIRVDSTGLKKASSETKRWSGAVAAGSALASGAIVAFGKKSIDAFGESQKVAAQTAAVIKSTGGAAGVTEGQVSGLAQSLKELSGVSDEEIQAGQNMLLTFTKIRNEAGKGNDIFNQATRTLLDFSVATGTDAKKAAIQLGKALNNPIKGVSALSRVGVEFTEEQKKLIKSHVDAGRVAEAQKVILAELKTEFGGSAKAAGAARTSTEKLAEKIDDLQEKVGEKLNPALDFAVDNFETIAPAIAVVGGVIVTSKIISAVSNIADGLKRITKNGGGAASTLQRFAGAGAAAGAAAGILAYAAVRYGDAIGKGKRATEGFVEALKAQRDGIEDALETEIVEQFSSDFKTSFETLSRLGPQAIQFVVDSVEDGTARTQAFRDELTRLAGNPTGKARRQLVLMATDIGALQIRTEDARRELGPMETVLKAVGSSAGSAAGAQGPLAGGLEGVEGAADEAADALQGYQDKLSDVLGVHVSAERAELRERDALASLSEALKDNRKELEFNKDGTLKLNKAGREVKDRFLDERDAIEAHALALAEDKGFTDDHNRITNIQIRRLRDLKARYPELRSEINEYIDRLKALKEEARKKPPEVSVRVRLKVPQVEINGQNISGKLVAVNSFHTGGFVPGPIGRERLILAKGGERVQTRSEASRPAAPITIIINESRTPRATGAEVERRLAAAQAHDARIARMHR